MISRDRAVDLARAECERRGQRLTDPIHVRCGILAYTVTDNVGSRGNNTSVVIDKCDGQVRSFAVSPM